MKLQRFRTPSWLGGLSLAILGVVIARLVSPMLTDDKSRVLGTVLGQTIAIIGLGWIALGIHRRIARQGGTPDTPDSNGGDSPPLKQ